MRPAVLSPVGRAAFDEAFAILDEAFPPSECRPYEEQRALLETSRYRLFSLADEAGGLAAVVGVYDFPSVLFVEHLAVRHDLRGGGFGSAALHALIASTEKQVILEVEPPETEIAARRIGFYRRHGFFLNEYPYIQPPISKGRSAIPLLIMSTQGPLSQSRFEQLRGLLYREVYHAEDPIQAAAPTVESDF